MSEPTALGTPVKRREDLRFITGAGRYTDDIKLPLQTYACFFRAPIAHGKISTLDVEAARQAPGVLAVYTGKDKAVAELGGLPCG